jgi:hypothetical protein
MCGLRVCETPCFSLRAAVLNLCALQCVVLCILKSLHWHKHRKQSVWASLSEDAVPHILNMWSKLCQMFVFHAQPLTESWSCFKECVTRVQTLHSLCLWVFPECGNRPWEGNFFISAWTAPRLSRMVDNATKSNFRPCKHPRESVLTVLWPKSRIAKRPPVGNFSSIGQNNLRALHHINVYVDNALRYYKHG